MYIEKIVRYFLLLEKRECNEQSFVIAKNSLCEKEQGMQMKQRLGHQRDYHVNISRCFVLELVVE